MTEFDIKQKIVEQLLKTDPKDWKEAGINSINIRPSFTYAKNDVTFCVCNQTGKTELFILYVDMGSENFFTGHEIGLVNTLYEKMYAHFFEEENKNTPWALIYNKAFNPA